MDQKSDGRITMGLFLVSLSSLAFELIISRVMSVVAWYHFAFMAICLALFGMTVGAVIVHGFKERFLAAYHRSLYFSSLWFSATLIINLLVICYLSAVAHFPRNIVLIFVSIVLPLVGSGVCISLILSESAEHAGRIYFVNLIGSSLGCLLFIPVINSFGVINAFFFLALLGCCAAYVFSAGNRTRRRLALYAVAALAVFPVINEATGFVGLRWVKGQRDQAFYRKWNSFSYIRLIEYVPSASPFGWGFSPVKKMEIKNSLITQIPLDIDAIAGTTVYDFSSRDVRKVSFLKYDLTALPYYLVHHGDVLVIGIGAGRDILTGIVFGEQSITGVEINESILDLHRGLLSGFTGDLSRYPGVRFIHNEARSFINSSSQKFDLIQISLIDTFAATQAGAYALTENSLYTVEAFRTYLEHLKPGGFLSVSYWLESPEWMLRLTGTATEALAGDGVSDQRSHLVIVRKRGEGRRRGLATLLVKKEPFSQDELRTIGEYCGTLGFSMILSPDGSAHESFRSMSDARTLRSYVSAYPFNISPATDDKPFFFLTSRLDFGRFLGEFKLFHFEAEYILFSLLLLMMLLSLIFVIVPVVRMTRKVAGFPLLRFSLYFAAIGFAYMLVEMSQVTRLSTFLGHPVYSLSVVLFAFLMGSGLGSYFLSRVDSSRRLGALLAVFLGLCALSWMCTTPLLRYFSRYPIAWRLIVSVLMVFPLAFFMGMFLPQGIRRAKNGPVALLWGLNGAMSVLGSVLAMIFQISWGLSATFLLGAALYAGAVKLLLSFEPEKNAQGA